ncbi:DUF6318 family protein [Modestobacter sp. VKM Ac-2986]|uniref:DUF6318 family protein n=1 Tax=Modestobacter sp. VKM Ac-2986 TaxID=3004140 RepID=UPI0022ABB059|nr:DUF6318 family protein [Modestobacter sp. VKM Ac-2986]MCZ2829885.1 DUF6318 family protein [Modestobacter sp. VKM Ac-2986]
MAIAVLAGCSSGETANETLPPVTSSAAPTSEALQPLGPPDLRLPAGAREQTAAGAKAFLDYYVELMNYSTTSLATESLRDLSRDCQTCSRFADGLDEVSDSQRRIEGAEFSINGSSDPLVRNGTAEFSMSLTQRKSRLLSAAGEPLPEFDQADTTFAGSGALLSWDAERNTWLMSNITFQ